MGYLIHMITLLFAMIASSLVNAIIEALVLALAVELCLRLLPEIKPSARFAIWIIVLFMVLPLHFTSLTGKKLGTSLAPHLSFFHLDMRLGLLIVSLWIALSLFRAIYLTHSALILKKICKEATPVINRPNLCALTVGSRQVRLCISKHVDRPNVVGFFQPKILLPHGLLEKLSGQELEQIVLHEMEHLRRRDDWTNLIQKIALIFFPLNPVLHWIERRLCIERELACDDCVLYHTSARKSYATCLTNLAEHSLIRRGVNLALGAWERPSELTRRVHRILQKPERMIGRTPTNVITGTVIAGILGGVVTLAHSPEIVSFLPVASIAIQAKTFDSLKSASSSAQPVVRNQNFSPTLVKAVMREPQFTNTSHHRSVSHRKGSASLIVPRQTQSLSHNWIILTRWQVMQTSHSLPATKNLESSYAAIPMENGWLVIQL